MVHNFPLGSALSLGMLSAVSGLNSFQSCNTPVSIVSLTGGSPMSINCCPLYLHLSYPKTLFNAFICPILGAIEYCDNVLMALAISNCPNVNVQFALPSNDLYIDILSSGSSSDSSKSG